MQLLNDRRPELVRQSDLVSDGAGLPLPIHSVDCVIAVIAADLRGNVAAIFAARMRANPSTLMLMDFRVEPIRQGLFVEIANRLDELAITSHARLAIVYASPELRRHAVPAATGGIDVQEIPRELVDVVDELLLSAAGHVADGRVKLCAPVVEKSRSAPFMGAFNFRSGEKADDNPLRRAAVLLLSMAMDIE